MKKAILFTLLNFIVFFAFSQQNSEENQIDAVLDNWHLAAAEANFQNYFDLMTENAIFIGTDATENWNKDEFMAYAKPHFDNGKAWNFTTLTRNIFSEEKHAWFDELLETQMGICRGSGILKKTGGEWKIAHYVLSISIPNDNVEEITNLKKGFDNQLITTLKKQ